MKYRDLNLIPWDENNYLVVSCDSAGGIGNKKGDIIRTEPRLAGFHTAQVALMEMLSIGVYPFALCNTLSVEMNPTGVEILKGIRDALDILGISEKVEITGSTEENMAVVSTGIGITLMGKIGKNDFRYPKTFEKDLAVVAGSSRSGEGVIQAKESELFNLKALGRITGKDYIHEIIPAGSGGIIHEIRELEIRENLHFNSCKAMDVDIFSSAGPATSALITLNRDHIEQLEKDIRMPIFVVGEFLGREDGEDHG